MQRTSKSVIVSSNTLQVELPPSVGMPRNHDAALKTTHTAKSVFPCFCGRWFGLQIVRLLDENFEVLGWKLMRHTLIFTKKSGSTRKRSNMKRTRAAVINRPEIRESRRGFQCSRVGGSSFQPRPALRCDKQRLQVHVPCHL